MNRAAIIATIVASILPFSSPSLAASDAEIKILNDKTSAAFRCHTYAGMFHDAKEARRLFQIGLEAGRDLMDWMKSHDDEFKEYLADIPTDFLVGKMYESESTKAYDEIGKGLDPELRVEAARLIYRTSNCSLIK